MALPLAVLGTAARVLGVQVAKNGATALAAKKLFAGTNENNTITKEQFISKAGSDKETKEAFSKVFDSLAGADKKLSKTEFESAFK